MSDRVSGVSAVQFLVLLVDLPLTGAVALRSLALQLVERQRVVAWVVRALLAWCDWLLEQSPLPVTALLANGVGATAGDR